MALPVYLEMEGIEGSSDRSDTEGMSEVLKFEYSVDKPTDVDTGRATGDRVHRPLKVLKRIDKASPLLVQYLCNGQSIPNVKLHFYAINPGTGAQEEYYTIALANATVVQFTPHMEHILDDDSRMLPHQEWVWFRFEEITFTYLDGNIEFQDSWRERS